MKTIHAFAIAALVTFASIASRAQQPATAGTESADAPGHEDGIVTLTRANLALVSIETETAGRGDLTIILKAVGRMNENLNKTAKVTSTLEGRLTRLSVDINDRVSAGDVVGLVETPELLGKPLELKSPIDGVVIERKSTVGELIDRDTEIYTISDPTDLWLLAEIKERDIGAVRLGQEAAFSVLAYPDERFRGKIVLVGNRVEPETRTLEVRVAVNNADGRLKPGMFADVEVATTAVRNALIVSDEAVQTMDNEKVVFVASGGGRFEKRVVKTGLEQHGRVQILSGVAEGERVVTEGSFILKSELLKGDLGEE